MKTFEKDELDALIEQNMTKTSSYYTFNCDQGPYRVLLSYKLFDDKEMILSNHGTAITLTHHNHKIGIGYRKTFDTLENAEIAAEIYNKMIESSSTSWNYIKAIVA